MRKTAGFALTVSLFAAALLMAPAQGAASQVIGSDLSGMLAVGNCGVDPMCTSSFDTLPRFGDATSDGVITAWALRENGLGAPEPVTLRVLRFVSPGTFLGVRSAPTDVFPAVPVGDDAVVTFPTRLPISAGDRIGFDHPTAMSICLAKPATGQVRWNPPLADGETRAGGGTGQNGGACETPVQAVVEPDADHDGYGDETQDQCPSDAGAQGKCPAGAPLPAPAPTGQRAAALKRCKKRAAKRDWSKKRLRKCKRKARALPL